MARDRSIKLIIQAQVDGAKRSLNETADAARKVGKATDEAAKQSTTASQRLVSSARDNQQAWNTAGTALTAFGAAAGVAMGGSAKAAVDWESAWAGVTKTVDGTTAQMAELEEGLRGMARELPASHSEIAAVAEAAGQLGIQTPNILDFTRTMIDLGEATNLSAEDAATALARFANIMGTSQSEFSNIGSAVVDLGNNFATTEREIVDMGLRLAGAGRQARLSEGEVLGLATALSSVGIEAQAGGTAFSKVIIEMAKSVDTQGDKLQTFADVAGMTADQFSAAWRDNAGTAIAAFVAGLGDMEASGQSIQPILEDLGMTDIRVGDALRRASGAADIFTGAMDKGNEAYAANVALSNEAAQRYATVQSRLDAAKNSVVDAGISLGEVFLPAIGAAADGVAGFAGWLADLPGPMQALAAGAGSAAASIGLIGGGFALALPRLIESYDAFKNLAGISPRVNDALGKMGKVAAGGGVLVGGLIAVGGALGAIREATRDAVPGVEAMTSALLDVADATDAAALDQMIADLSIQVNGLSGMVEGPLTSFEDVLLRITDPTLIQRAEGLDKAISFGQIKTSGDDAAEVLGRLDEALVSLVSSGNIETAERLFSQFADRADAVGVSSEEFAALLPGYGEALAGLGNEARLAGEDAAAAGGSFDEFGSEIADAAAEAEAAQEAYDGLKSSIETLGSVLLGARGSARDFEAAIDAVDARMGEDGFKRTLDITTEAGRKNQAVLDGVASSTVGYATAALEAGAGSEELAGIMARGREEFIKAAEALGMTSDDAATLATNLGLVPDNVRMLFEAAGIDELIQEVDGVQDYTRSLEALIQLGVDPAVAEQYLNTFVNTERETTVGVDADPTKAKNKQADLLRSIDTSEGTVDIDGNPAKADGKRRDAVSRINASGGTVTIDGKNGLAIAAAQAAVWSINRMSAVINVTARYAGGLNMGGANRLYSSARASGGIVRGFAPHVAGPATGVSDLYRMGLDGSLTHYAESGRGLTKEWYLSDHPAYKRENVGYALDALRHLGGAQYLKNFAAGGTVQRWSAPSVAAASPGPVTAVLAPEHAALLAAAVDQDIVLKVDSREVARATRRGEQSFGAPGRWSGAPRMGRSGS